MKRAGVVTVNVIFALLLVACGPSTDGSLYSHERTEYVMGTMLHVRVEAASDSLALLGVDSAFATVHRFDRLLSNYDSTSEISAVALQAPEAVSVSKETFDFVHRTMAWAHLTDGAINPAIGPVVRAWGFYTEEPERPSDPLLIQRLAESEYTQVQLDADAQTIRVRTGMELDPGATGKGYALKVAERTLAAMGVTSFDFDFGGQIHHCGADTVLVPVRHPRSDTQAVAWLAIDTGSVATSGDYERYFDEDGTRYSHIIDPRTGYPVQGRAAVTVFARDAFVADVLSTTLFVLGPDQSEELLEQAQAGALFAEWESDSLVFIIKGRWPEAP
jgi:thiamine biosynthesis lipoprotein